MVIFFSLLCVSDTFELGAGLDASSTAASVAGSGVLSWFIIGNALPLKLWRTLSLVGKNNPLLFRKYFSSTDFGPLSKLFNLLAKIAHHQHFLILNILSYLS